MENCNDYNYNCKFVRNNNNWILRSTLAHKWIQTKNMLTLLIKMHNRAFPWPAWAIRGHLCLKSTWLSKPIYQCVRPVRYVLLPVFGQNGHCWAPDRSSNTSSIQVCSGRWLGDGADAVSTAIRRLKVCDTAVLSGRWSVDGGLLACDVTVLLIWLLVCCSLWSLQSSYGWVKCHSVRVMTHNTTRNNDTHKGELKKHQRYLQPFVRLSSCHQCAPEEI